MDTETTTGLTPGLHNTTQDGQNVLHKSIYNTQSGRSQAHRGCSEGLQLNTNAAGRHNSSVVPPLITLGGAATGQPLPGVQLNTNAAGRHNSAGM